jgi:hypothetical protein
VCFYFISVQYWEHSLAVLVFITPPTPGIVSRALGVEGQLYSRSRSWTDPLVPQQAFQGPRCGLKFAVSRGLEAQVTSNHPMFLPPSSLDYRTEPLVPATELLIPKPIIVSKYCSTANAEVSLPQMGGICSWIFFYQNYRENIFKSVKHYQNYLESAHVFTFSACNIIHELFHKCFMNHDKVVLENCSHEQFPKLLGIVSDTAWKFCPDISR